MAILELILSIMPLFLCIVLLGKVHFEDDKVTVFGLDDCKIMRGFWCIVVLLVHVPVRHSNMIQKTVGSLAYIGVTFFFMTSGYGLTLERIKCSRRNFIKGFWPKRLHKILITCLITNITVYLIWGYFIKGALKPDFLLRINSWIIWLWVCYLIFWISNLISGKEYVWKTLCILFIAIFSGVVYYLNVIGEDTDIVWVTEIYGFIWGVVLAGVNAKVTSFFKKQWSVKLTICLFMSFLLGICKIHFRNSVFYGDYVLKIMLGLMIVVLMLILNARISLESKIGTILGEISFEFYLIHLWVFSVVEEIVPDSSSGLYIVLCIIVSALVSYADHYLIKLLRRLSGVS